MTCLVSCISLIEDHLLYHDFTLTRPKVLALIMELLGFDPKEVEYMMRVIKGAHARLN